MNESIFYTSQLLWVLIFLYLYYFKSRNSVVQKYTNLSVASAYFPNSVKSSANKDFGLEHIVDYDVYAFQRAREADETVAKMQIVVPSNPGVPIGLNKQIVAFKDSSGNLLGLSFSVRVLSLVDNAVHITNGKIKCVAVYKTGSLFIGSFLQEEESSGPKVDIETWLTELKSEYKNVILLGHSRDGHAKIKSGLNSINLQLIPLDPREKTDILGNACRDFIISNNHIPRYITHTLMKNWSGSNPIQIGQQTEKAQLAFTADVYV